MTGETETKDCVGEKNAQRRDCTKGMVGTKKTLWQGNLHLPREEHKGEYISAGRGAEETVQGWKGRKKLLKEMGRKTLVLWRGGGA